MKELKVIKDFTVTQSGDAFISTRKVSELTGVPRRTLRGWIDKNAPYYNTNKNNQLDAKSLSKVVLYAHDREYPKATVLLDKILEAGAKAFIYYNAEKVTPEQLKIANLQEELKSKVKLVGVSSQVNRTSLHQQRKQLFEEGLCDHWTETVKHHYFPVNQLGKEAGYSNMGSGKRRTIKL